MKPFVTGLAAASLVVSLAAAQTTATHPAPQMTPAAGSTATPARPLTGNTLTGNTATGATAAAPTGASPGTVSGTTAASGNNNQAVATTSANAPSPAKGRNSYTVNQARSRIQARGFAQVADLKKDANGVWRGKGQKDGASVDVWLDYKGNVGQQ